MRSVAGTIVGRVEVYTDITESRRLYTQLLNSERLRASHGHRDPHCE